MDGVMLAGKTLAITGIGGFIGARLAARAHDWGMTVRGLDANPSAGRKVGRGIEIVTGDVADPAALRLRIFQEVRVSLSVEARGPRGRRELVIRRLHAGAHPGRHGQHGLHVAPATAIRIGLPVGVATSRPGPDRFDQGGCPIRVGRRDDGLQIGAPPIESPAIQDRRSGQR
jgi:hypothetical protein